MWSEILLIALVLTLIVLLFCLKDRENWTQNLFPIYCINLDRSTDRWANIQTQAQAQGFRVKRFAAIDGFQISNAKLLRDRILSPLTPFTKGTVGCYLSHRKCWEHIAASSEPYALVIEDDVRFDPQFVEKVRSVLDRLPSWDIVYLGMTRPFGKKVDKDIYRAHQRINTNAGAYAYLITREMAGTLLTKCAFPMRDMIDHCMKQYHQQHNVFFVYPYLITHDFDHDSVRLRNKVYSKEYIKKTNTLTIAN